MPELPEVETVKEKLKQKVLNRTIKDITINWNNIIAYPNISNFKKNIINQTINDITRHGKWLIFHLDNYYLLSHLRMEGKYYYKESTNMPSKHEQVIFHLDNNFDLRYVDSRKFGKMHLIKKEEINKYPTIIKLGLDPWDINLSVDYLKEKYNRKLPIKTLLLDQTIISGIGNIYADEILFKCKINPNRKGCLLRDKDLQNIIKYTKEILEEAIIKGGTTIRSYTSEENVTGHFQNNLLVHGKQNSLCLNCKSKIIKIKVGQRGTYYCPECQKR